MRTQPPHILPGCPYCNNDHDPSIECRFKPVSTRGHLTEDQLTKLATKVARRYVKEDKVDRADVLREVVRTKKLNLEESLIMRDCIVKGLYQAGKTIVVTA